MYIIYTVVLCYCFDLLIIIQVLVVLMACLILILMAKHVVFSIQTRQGGHTAKTRIPLIHERGGKN